MKSLVFTERASGARRAKNKAPKSPTERILLFDEEYDTEGRVPRQCRTLFGGVFSEVPLPSFDVALIGRLPLPVTELLLLTMTAV